MILALLLFAIIIVIILFYTHSVNTPATPSKILSIDLTAANSLLIPSYLSYTALVYTASSTPGVYIDSNNANCIGIYTDVVNGKTYYYGCITVFIGGPVYTYGANTPINGIVCFNPDNNSVLSSEILALLETYSGITAGVNVESTSLMDLYRSGTSPSAIGPKSTTMDLNGNINIIW